ncbi:hypothetical protein D3C87_1935530 [compost metagenome]
MTRAPVSGSEYSVLMDTSMSYPKPPTSTQMVGGSFSIRVPVMRPIMVMMAW